MDNAATTAVRKEVAEAMLPYLLGDYGNPSGVYRLSEKAKNVVEESRGIIADIINADDVCNDVGNLPVSLYCAI